MTGPTDPGPPRVCAGCGGRNAPGALECDWCGRTFISQGRRLRLAGWQIASSVLLLALLGALVALGILNSGRPLPSLAPQRAAAPSAAASPTGDSPTPAVTPRVLVASSPTPRPSPTELPGAAFATPATPVTPAAPTATPTPPPRRAALVANTGGAGVTIRAEPGPQAAALGTLREGAAVQLTGAEQTVAARLWREVQEPTRGLTGWVAAEFLSPQP